MRTGVVILLGLLCYLAELQTALAFLLAALWHEVGHILTARLLGGRIRLERAGMTGAVLAVSGLTLGMELVCTLAGPLFGLTLLPLGGLYPQLALFALGQCLYNLLPVYPMDGGRALFCGLVLALGEDKGWAVTRIVGGILGLLLAALAVFGAVFLHYGLAFGAFGGIFLYRALCLFRGNGIFCCKEGSLPVQ